MTLKLEKTNEYIKNLIDRMSLDQKVGALFTLGFTGVVPGKHIYDYIMKYNVGGLRLTPQIRSFGSYVNPQSDEEVVTIENVSGVKNIMAPTISADNYRKVLAELKALALTRPNSIPLHLSADQEGGASSDFYFEGIEVFPKPMGLRATGDKKLAYLAAKSTAEQAKSLGINWLHSPVLDIATVADNPEVGIRAYSDDVDQVVNYAIESTKGFKDGNLIATGKHFPGRGHSSVDAHYGIPVIDIDKETLYNRELKPYKALISRGLLPSIMLAHSIFPAVDNQIATMSKVIVTDILRGEMGFQGVITTDSMTMGGIAMKYDVPTACALSLEAGADLVLLKAENQLVDQTFAKVKEFINNGRISQEELDNKVYRILNLKYEYGLFYNNEPSEKIKEVNHAQVADIIAKKSILIAREEENVFPLSKDSKVLVIEQNKMGADTFSWHSGILYENCVRIGADVDYLEIDYIMDKEDIRNIKQRFDKYKTIVITNYYNRAKLSNKKQIETIFSDYKGELIVVTNTPFQELSIPDNARNVLITFANAPRNVAHTAKMLFGDEVPEGEWPLEHYQISKSNSGLLI